MNDLRDEDQRREAEATRPQAPRESSRYWRSLGELAGDEAYEQRIADYVRAQHPSQMPSLADPVERRAFLQLMGASFALAGLSACTRQPDETIHPYARNPESLLPGEPLYFATAMPWTSGAIGLLVESHMGRPTKVEGNPDHPASLGAADALSQASVLGLYDPDRSKVVTHKGRVQTYGAFLTALAPELEIQKARQGAGLRILTETVTSPTLAAQLRELLARYPQARWHQYEPVNRDRQRAASLLAFGEDLVPRLDLSKADVIVSFEADFLAGPGGVRLARDFAARRRDAGNMNRLYVVESSPTITGAMADHRLALPPAMIERAMFALSLIPSDHGDFAEVARVPEELASWITALALDLARHRGRSVIVAGESLSPHAYLDVMSRNAYGRSGDVLVYGEPVECEPVDQTESLRALADDMREGKVEILVILGANPVYHAPEDLHFRGALDEVPLRIHLGLYDDETAQRCHWHLPQAHFLESWSDARAFDGTVSFVQPLIAPLYGGASAHELVAALAGKGASKGYDLVREHWKQQLGDAADFERVWRRALHDGVLAGSATPARVLQKEDFLPLRRPSELAPPPETFELALRPDSSTWDGRFANNGWLQEVPRPLTKLTWDNAALVSPATAKARDLESGDVVELDSGGRKLRAPALVLPGQADGCITLHLGYGRERAGKLGTGVGANAFALRASQSLWGSTGVALARTGAKHDFAITQEHHDMHGRDLIRETTAEGFARGEHGAPDEARVAGQGEARATSLYPGFAYEGSAWGMVIDLSSCIGCNACVVACQAENNVPIVGADQVRRGREMHWIRIDRYFSGEPGAPKMRFQPIPCMHCENAPCEVVCPVGATVHSPEGLNEMVYNRCVGTKYCANNCPYKVRRFNFYEYSDLRTPTIKMQKNPDVTVRTRGVMEKCTYCVQRIQAARIQAKKDDRPVRDGEVVPACQQTCPAQAITFGDINDRSSAVAKLRAAPHHYGLLAELGTRPRTTYLARISNPNPSLGEFGEQREER